MQILANLDCEATWAARPLPVKIKQRLATMSTLLRALATDDDVVLHTVAAPVTNAITATPKLPPLQWAVDPRNGTTWPAAAGLAWASCTAARRLSYDPGDVPWRNAIVQPAVADAIAKAANDRRLTLHVRAQAGVSLPLAACIDSAAALHAHLQKVAPLLGPGGWVCKAPWTAAGRDRVWGQGTDAGAVQRAETLLRSCGALIFEPWLDRLDDFGVLATVDAEHVTQRAPHRLLCNAHGGFAGIDIGGASHAPVVMTTAERDTIVATVEAAGITLRGLGYRGPFTIDGFFYQAGHQRRLAPLCEINARLSFGWVALACATRLGGTSLRIGQQAPTMAQVLIQPTPQDPFAVWVD